MKRAVLLIQVVCVFLIGAANGARAADPSPAPSATPAANPSVASGSSSPTASPSPAIQELPPIEVTATRIEQPVSDVGETVTVLSGKDIQEQKIPNVADALREIPGVEITQSGSPGTETDASIRGSTAAETLIMADGVELNTGATGGFDLANLTTHGLDRIEVVRGAGGALYGSSAIGGVINMLTPEGEGAPRFSLLSDGGSASTENQALSFSGAQDKLHYSGAVSYFSTMGYQPINDESDKLSGALRLDYDLTEDTTLRGFARYYTANVELVNFLNSFGVLDPTAHQRSEFMLYKGEIDHRFTEWMDASASAYFVRDDLRLNEAPLLNGGPLTGSSEVDRVPDEIRGGTLETHLNEPWQLRAQGSNLADHTRTIIGFDFKDRWVRTFNASAFAGSPPFESAFRARRHEYAGYVEQEASLMDGRVLATGGFRTDGNSQFGKEVSPTWALAIPLKRIDATLRGSYSEGFRAPSFDELFFPDFGNPKLRPEISSEYDGGIKKQLGEGFTFTATYFSRRVHSLIVTVPCPTCVFGAQAGNAGRVDTQGVELVPAIGPFNGVTLSGNFTFLDETHVSGSPTTRPTRVPKKAAFGLAQYVRDSLWREHDKAVVSVAYIFVGDRDDITTGSTISSHDAYHRFDLVMSYAAGVPWKLITDEEVFVRVQNLLDRRYSEAFGFPSPPVNAVAGIKVDF